MPRPAQLPPLKRRTPPQALRLRPFQSEGVAFVRKHEFRCLIADAPGTGKTIQVLAAVSIERHRVAPMLVIAPSSVTENWSRESARWAPWAKCHVITDEGTPLPRERVDIVVCPWALLYRRVVELATRGFKLIVADEAHFAKSSEAQRSIALAALARRVPHLILLTGTPLVNEEAELQELASLFGLPEGQYPPMIRRLLEDVAPDIPPKTRRYVPVELSTKHAQEYAKAEADFRDWLEDRMHAQMEMGEAQDAADAALAAEALVKVGYLRRIVGQGKVAAAVEWIARAVRAGEPVVAFAEHQDVIDGVIRGLRRLRIACSRLDGSASKTERQKAIDDFQRRAAVPVFIGSKAAKEGITLTRARHLVFIERYWTAAEEEQAEDRIRRIGQRRPTTIWFLYAKDTVDDRIREIIDGKRVLVRNTIGAADVEENTVRNLLGVWTRGQVVAPAKQESALSPNPLGKAGQNAPALPKAREVHAFMFDPRRWNTAEAYEWVRINGYKPGKVERAGRCIRVLQHAPVDFRPGTFRRVVLSADIHAVIGEPRQA